MKKTFILFISIMSLGMVALFVLPGFLMKEANQVQLREEVLVGIPTMVEGVRVTCYSHYGGRLFWNTEYTAGTEPEVKTEQYFIAAGEGTHAALTASDAYWYEKRGYGQIQMFNKLSGGWSFSSSGGFAVNSWNVSTRELETPFMELDAETKAGEKKSRQIFLDNYMEYFPINVAFKMKEGVEVYSEVSDVRVENAYSEYFKIPVPEYASYTIFLKKDESGEIVELGGQDGGQGIFHWNSVSASSETDFYFTFYRYTTDGTRVDTSLIPGGFGVYRQPYSIVDGELVIDAKKLSMVYSLEEEMYPYGSMFLDVNGADQLVILTDNETTTSLQVVDMETWELVQRVELDRPAESTRFEYVVRATEDFFVLWYGNGYFSLVDRTEENGYGQQFLIRLESEDPLYYHAYVNENDMDWNGERLVYACYGKHEYSAASNCNLELTVYDETGKIYHGRYFNSLLTKQEYSYQPGTKNNWSLNCEPRTNVCIDVEWP